MEQRKDIPAFPVPNSANLNEKEGMTLRDYLAAKAMQILVADECYNSKGWPHTAAEDSYRIADAMLAEREK